ncbi:oligoendopeptidase F [Halocatena pleomorpha]|uniref:Oligoendopeptidase F n=1 Tax=Halocatena pleomorpha TaxID=1785090 RepID=A0A3P3REW8_9EURY|nr:oligoendopeptidase F [Halocatena pleomorpha]RRJ32066.1 oligoendopeptidase F [Halocatena pleomorpha]
MSSVPERGKIEEQYKWDTDDLFVNDAEWEDSYETAESLIEELKEYEGRVTEDAETLLSVLRHSERMMRIVSNVATYTRMRSDEDTRNQQYQALSARAQSLVADARSAAGFIEPEIQTLTEAELADLMDHEPALEQYEQYFDDVLRLKPHTRSTTIERLLADFSDVTDAPGEIYTMLTNADMTFPAVEDPDENAVEITLSNFTTLQKNPDRAFRKEVYETFYDEWESVRNAIGAAYKKSVTADVKQARTHNYETAREAKLDGTNIPISVYDTLVETVNDNLSVLHEHLELKRDVLDLDELRMWDVYMSLTGDESPTVTYEQARTYVTDAVAPLGEEYQSRLADGLDARWVDVYENAGKRSGAYSSGTYDTQPYILMNYQDDVSSLFTLAHELGHSMHSQLTKETQPYVYSDYEIFVAEVASTVNETLLTHHLLETVDDEQLRRHVLDQYLERFRSTLLRQTMFAEFEQRTHEIVEDGGALTPDRLDELYGGLKRTYLEPAVVDDRIDREWMRIPHFYNAFYVYQYATGISAAVAIVDRLLDDDEPNAAEQYRQFLNSGSREYPLELLQNAGVDMQQPAPIETTFSTYEEYLGVFEQLN